VETGVIPGQCFLGPMEKRIPPFTSGETEVDTRPTKPARRGPGSSSERQRDRKEQMTNYAGHKGFPRRRR
jgi:hypothetical protein